MGVPGFFSWILRKCHKSEIIIKNIPNRPNELYVDANCLFHPACFKVLHSQTEHKKIDELENLMIKQCIIDLNILVKRVNPAKLLYVAVDGVAPMAKMQQQRKRRYKSIIENDEIDKIKREFGKPILNTWSNTVITPGTEFMEKLHKEMMKYLESLESPAKIIYSSYHTNGEGEHKILDFIRKSYVVHNEKNIQVIYGLDADLLFLAMSLYQETSQWKEIYVIRENDTNKQKHYDSKKNDVCVENIFSYINIGSLIDNFIEILNNKKDCATNEKFTRENTVRDIIFVCYFLGNDFIPNIPTLDIKRCGLDLILDAYVNIRIKHKTELIKNIGKKNVQYEFDVLFLSDFLSQLVPIEKNGMICEDECTTIQSIPPSDSYERAIWDLENLMKIPKYDVFKKYLGNIDDWKFRYYEYYFGCIDNQEKYINDVCKNYLDGLRWIFDYYFCGETDGRWEWMYKYNVAPFVSDLSKYMKTYRYNINMIHFDPDKPVKPSVQLLCVIPKKYFDILPNNMKKMVESDNFFTIGYMFPNKFILDLMNKDVYWKCLPILPNININEIKKFLGTMVYHEIYDKVCDDIIIKNILS